MNNQNPIYIGIYTTDFGFNSYSLFTISYSLNEEIIMFFDSHAHLDDERFDADRDSLIEEIKNSGVHNIINIGSDMESSRRSVKLAEKYGSDFPLLIKFLFIGVVFFDTFSSLTINLLNKQHT